jgi:Tfp pilus assembly protein PilN
MTTAVTPQPAVSYDQDSLRLLPITANLLPPEVIDARRGRKMKRVLAGILAAGVFLTAVWYVYAKHEASGAQTELTNSQRQLVRLRSEQNRYNDVVTTQASIAALKNELAQLMQGDLQWWQLIPALRAVAPAGVVLTAVSGTLTAVGGAPAAAPTAGLATGGSVGTLTISGSAPDKNSVAAFVDALATVPGVANPFVTGVQSPPGKGTTFSVQLEISSSALGGRFSPPSATPTPSATGSH